MMNNFYLYLLDRMTKSENKRTLIYKFFYSWRTPLLPLGISIVLGLFTFVTVETYKANNMGFETKSYWDWLELLIVPMFLAGGAIAINLSQKSRELKIEQDRQAESALQIYINEISKLLLEKKLRTTEEPEVRDVARTRTISVMRVLDSKRNHFVLRFLQDAKLITDENSILKGADMFGFKLTGAYLAHSFLQQSLLSDSNLMGAWFVDAQLEEINLSDANLALANLLRANLKNADLAGADMRRADLQDADLRGADLHDTDLRYANLIGVNFSGANLLNAKVDDRQLRQFPPEFLKDATMPDGTKHE